MSGNTVVRFVVLFIASLMFFVALAHFVGARHQATMTWTEILHRLPYFILGSAAFSALAWVRYLSPNRYGPRRTQKAGEQDLEDSAS
jgi:hypothetical protein